MAKAPRPRRGEIWSVRFDPSIGAEIRKLRPAVVVSLDSIGRLPLRIVVPLTDWQATFSQLPWFTQIPSSPASGLVKDSGADAFQFNSLSETRFVSLLGTVTQDQLEEIGAATALCVGAP